MHDSRPLSLVGIGFGPQGVAMAAAIEDLGERLGANLADRVAFFERAELTSTADGDEILPTLLLRAQFAGAFLSQFVVAPSALVGLLDP